MDLPGQFTGPHWVSDFIGYIALLGAFRWLVINALKPVYERLTAVLHLSDRMDEIEQRVMVIQAEVTPNGGGSMKDSLHRLEKGHSEIREQLTEGKKRFEVIEEQQHQILKQTDKRHEAAPIEQERRVA